MKKIKPFVSKVGETLEIRTSIVSEVVEKHFSSPDTVANKASLDEYVSANMKTLVLDFVCVMVDSADPHEFLAEEYDDFSFAFRSIYADIHGDGYVDWNADHGQHNLFGNHYSSPFLNDGADFHDELQSLVFDIFLLRKLANLVKAEYFAEQMVA